MGKLKREDLLVKYSTYPFPPWLDPDNLPKINWQQVVWYDEMNIEQEGGACIFNNLQIRFHIDEHGWYNPTSNLIIDRTFKASYKYANKAKFCLGVAKVQMLDWKMLGIRNKVFDYTGKQIVSLIEWRLMVAAEIQRAYNLRVQKNSP